MGVGVAVGVGVGVVVGVAGGLAAWVVIPAAPILSEELFVMDPTPLDPDPLYIPPEPFVLVCPCPTLFVPEDGHPEVAHEEEPVFVPAGTDAIICLLKYIFKTWFYSEPGKY